MSIYNGFSQYNSVPMQLIQPSPPKATAALFQLCCILLSTPAPSPAASDASLAGCFMNLGSFALQRRVDAFELEKPEGEDYDGEQIKELPAATQREREGN